MKHLVVFLALLGVFVALNGCPGASFPASDGLRCLHDVNNVKLHFTDAEAFCSNFGGHLASVHSRADNDLIASQFEDVYWIGLSNVLTNDLSSWSWIDGTPFDFAFWADGQPADAVVFQNCLLPSCAGLWAPEMYSVAANFVCATPTSPIDAPTAAPPTAQLTSPQGAVCSDKFKYELVGSLVSFSTSERICRFMNGHLTSVADADENALVSQLLSSHKIDSAWIGGKFDSYKGITWIDGTTSAFTAWRHSSNYPIPAPFETCLQSFGSIGWANVMCNAALVAVCKIPL